MKNKPLAIKLLEYLDVHFPSSKQYPINSFLIKRKESKDEVLSILKGMDANSYIHHIENLETVIDGKYVEDIKTNITGEGDTYIKSYFETRYHKRNIIFNNVSAIIAIVLTIYSLGFGWYTWKSNLGKDIEMQKQKDTIKTQETIIKDMSSELDSLRRNKYSR